MKRILCTIVAAIGFLSFAGAQRAAAVLKGRVIDTSAGRPLRDASVSLFRAKDSTLLTFSLTNAQGIFEINGLDAGTYHVLVSHEGFREIDKEVVLALKQVLDLGQLSLAKDFRTLGEVVVSSTTPIMIKKDTIQFNANAFKTQPNATVEDLLKKLPGVEVDRQGSVKAQGEQVQKIYVDGKEFFGNDPKMATQNLTADMVESVQVFDDMSDQAKFTKIDDGSRAKAINIKLKKNRKQGYFGRVTAGYGDQGKYKASATANKFNETQRISIVANGNNINEQGFSLYEGPATGGNGRGSLRGGGGSGINKTWSTGFNYVDQWGKKIKASGSYFLSNANSRQEQGIFRQSIFTDSTALLNRSIGSSYINRSHRFNLRVEYQLDSATSILYTPSFSLQHSDNVSSDSSFGDAQLSTVRYRAITGKTMSSNRPVGHSWNNNLLFRHRFNKSGRTLVIGWNNSTGHNNNEGYALSENNFYTQDAVLYRSIYQNQQNNQHNNTQNNIISTSYTEPFGKNRLLELNYAYSRNVTVSDRSTFDYNPATAKYDYLNLVLTNRFENTLLAHRAGLNFRSQQAKFNYQLGLSLQQSTQESNSHRAVTGKDSVIIQRYINFFPTANLSFTPARGKSFQFRYNGRNNAPIATQLQNILDVSDPLNVRTGNPSLRQEFNHSLAAVYNSFNMQTLRFLAANINFSTTANKIVNSIDTLTSGVQLTKPQNVNGYYLAGSYITVGVSSKNPRLKGSNISFTNSISYSHDISLLYRKKNIGQTLNVQQGISANINKEKFDISVRANVMYSRVKYSVNSALNEEYFMQTYSGDLAYSFSSGINVLMNFDYYVSTGRTEGYNQRIPLLTAAISKLFFKKKNGELRFTVNDILNQNQSVSRSTGDNFIQDTHSIVLKRYFLVSFLYNWNKMGGKANRQ